MHPPPILWGGIGFPPPPFSKVDGGEFGYFPPPLSNRLGGNWTISHQAMGGEIFWPPDVMGGQHFWFPPHRVGGKAQIVSKTARIVAKNQILGRFWAVYG